MLNRYGDPPNPGQRTRTAYLNGKRWSDEVDLVLELAQQERQPQWVSRDPCRGRLSSTHLARPASLEDDLGHEGGSEVDEDVHLAPASVPGCVRGARRHHDLFAGAVVPLDAGYPRAQRAVEDCSKRSSW